MMSRLRNIMAACALGVSCAPALAMPVVVPHPGSALLAWLLAIVLIVACTDALEGACPGAVPSLWSLELRIFAMLAQVMLDRAYPRLGDATVVVGYALMVSVHLRVRSFPQARVIGARPPFTWPPLRKVLAMALFALPAIAIVHALLAEWNISRRSPVSPSARSTQ